MNVNSFKVFAGYSSIIAGILLITAHVINLIGGMDEGTLTGSSFVFAAHLILVIALFGIYLFQAGDSKILGLLGMVLSVLGNTVVCGIIFVEIAAFSGVNTELVFKASANSVIYSVGPLLFVLGMLLLGVSMLLSKKASRIGGLLFILGTIVFALASVIGSEKLLIEVIGAALTGLGFIWCGTPMIQGNHNNNSMGLDA